VRPLHPIAALSVDTPAASYILRLQPQLPNPSSTSINLWHVCVRVCVRLGSGYAKLPDGSNTLFTKAEGRTAELVDLKVRGMARPHVLRWAPCTRLRT
jgi:hypothetical protein